MEDQLKRGSRFGPARLAVVALFVPLALLCAGQVAQKGGVLSAVADENTGVRFFYQHDIKDYFYPPLIVRVAGPGDPKMNTAPWGPEGRSVFVTLSEMQQLLGRLARSEASWRESDKVDAFGPSYEARGLDYLDITIVSAKGTARSGIGRNSVCKFLASLDSAITTPRALWELQWYRWVDECEVPRFNPKSYPDHHGN